MTPNAPTHLTVIESDTVSIAPFVSVVVPALNCADDVERFSEAIRSQDYPSERIEVIVVDNGSTDDTLERARNAGMIVLQRKERGRTKALNTGVALAKGEFILTTDLSCRAEPHWIRTVIDTFAAHPEAGCVAGEIKLLRTTVNNAVIDFQARNNYMSPLAALRRTRLPYMPFADGANASFRRKVFDEIGGFEESFVKAGDVEICYRMFVLTDYSLIFNRAALVWEPGEPSLRALLHQRFRIGIGWNLMMVKYPALYATQESSFNLRRAWWELRDLAGELGRLAVLNAGLLLGRKREAATDANIQQLMNWSQWYGRHYGRWWLKRREIQPREIDSQRLRTFMLRNDSLAGRIGEIDESAIPDAHFTTES